MSFESFVSRFVEFMLYVVGPMMVVAASVFFMRLCIRRFLERPSRRVWCICRVNGVVGLWPRRSYDRSSREFWKWVKRGGGTPDSDNPVGEQGHLLKSCNPQEVIVVRDHTPELFTLVYGLHLERREFYVPSWNPLDMQIAHERVHGKPWNGIYIR